MPKRLRTYEPLQLGLEWPDSFMDPDHIASIEDEISTHLTTWTQRFLSSVPNNRSPFSASIAEFEKELPSYQKLLSPELLEDFSENPGGFKDFIKDKCPIIHSTLITPAEEFERYRQAFKRSSGEKLLQSITGIANFARGYIAKGGAERHDLAKKLEDFDLEAVEELGVEGVIGTGIMSLLLHMISPAHFPVRNKDSLIGLFFLSDKKYGLFLVEHPERMGRDEGLPLVEPNWKYPYERFVSHAALVYRHLKEVSEASGRPIDARWRYRYVEAFLSFIADQTKDYRREVWREKKFNKFGGH